MVVVCSLCLVVALDVVLALVGLLQLRFGGPRKTSRADMPRLKA